MTTDASGRGYFSDRLLPGVRSGEVITATATQTGGTAPERSTSEFSDCRPVG